MSFHSPRASGLAVQHGSLAPYWHDKTTASRPGFTSSYYRQGDVRPIRGDGRRSCTHITCIVKAVPASLLATVPLLTLCSSAQRKRKLPSFLPHRKLSGRNVSPPEELLQCAGRDEGTYSATGLSEEALTILSEKEKTDIAKSHGDSTASGSASSDEEAGPSAKMPR